MSSLIDLCLTAIAKDIPFFAGRLSLLSLELGEALLRAVPSPRVVRSPVFTTRRASGEVVRGYTIGGTFRTLFALLVGLSGVHSPSSSVAFR